MKRLGYLYEQVYEWDNLLRAFWDAKKGKSSADLSSFEYDWECKLLEMQSQLRDQSYRFGSYRQFEIYEPKQRTISCAPFRDRVLHHAICNVIMPILEKSMIVDSFACRKEKGLHKALRRAFWFYQNSAYHYRLDVKKYFYTIDHQVLLTKLTRKFKDRKLLILLEQLLDTYDSGVQYYFPTGEFDIFDMIRPRGLPIGNLTSQLFANFYLSELDHYVREQLHHPFYIRYMDDVIVFGQSRGSLKDVSHRIRLKLEEIRLCPNEKKDYIHKNTQGIDFLGFRLHENRIKLRSRNLVRFRRKLKSRKVVTDFSQLLRSINGHIGYLTAGHTKKLINSVFEDIEFTDAQRKWKMVLP
ncbi:MAG: reverse transcriptase domain-containing protein [Candidatus Cloacimonetes bacterium]|jgi:retron-type reverse transcriptase|nr:reverse transcriptase domain-containing protein [Candidatus Cloacimonadota bacterium]